ncbi:MAG: PAS domain S-box protein [Gemmataceae bacterium]
MLKEQDGLGVTDYLTVGDAARLLGVSPGTLRNWDRAGKLKAARHPKNGYRIYHHEDLRAAVAPLASPHDGSAAEFDWSDVGTAGHFVQFYESDDFLADSVSAFIGDGFDADAGSIVIATPKHRREIDDRLRVRGIDPETAAAQGQYLALDAAETLARFMSGDSPDPARFAEVIGEAIARVGKGRPGLRAFGEMVALLWADGNRAAAVRLEELWNDLARTHTFALLCAYPIAGLGPDEPGGSFADVCACHTRVAPAEGFPAAMAADERRRAVAELQCKARALEAEVAHRAEVEKQLISLRERQTADAIANARLAAIVESSQDAIVSKTLDGTILSWNTGAERIFGYTAAEAIGRHITIIIPPDRLGEEQLILEKIGRGERVEHFETVRVAKDGHHIGISVTISPIRDDTGRIVAASKVARDITDRNRAEAALRESNRRFRMALASGAVTAFEQDTDLRYTWVYPQDPAFPQNNIGRTDAELLPAEDGAELMRLKRQVLETQQPLRCTIRAGLPHEARYYDLLAEPRYDSTGRLVGIGGAALDITAQKRTEEALREADRRKDEFLAVLAHELRNPLAPVRSALQIMRLAGDNRYAVEQARSMMERQVQQMVRLVDDLLDVSRITRGNVELKKERVALSSVVATAVETSRPLIEAARHELHVAIPAETVELEADATRLAQVLSNLLNNAAKYSDPGGKIWVTAQRDGPQVEVGVRDTGIGIPREMLPRVFDLFTQVDRGSDKTQGGLGVGLSLVRNLVEMHGGSVSAHSDGPGRGSEFTIRLPLAAERPAAAGGPNGPQAGAAARPMRRVLVVDDNTDAALALGMLLRMLGHDVRTAPDGPAALEEVAEFRPEVAFLDIGMPGMSGYDLARQLRATPGGESTFLVALTGWGQAEDRRYAHEAGFDEHLTKPADPAKLVELLHTTRPPAG